MERRTQAAASNPPGFIAFGADFSRFRGGGSRPRGVRARVASPRCPILRPGNRIVSRSGVRRRTYPNHAEIGTIQRVASMSFTAPPSLEVAKHAAKTLNKVPSM